MKKQIVITVALAAAALVAGYFLGRGNGAHAPGHEHGAGVSAGAGIKFWSCSMHPQVRQPNPGKCPICSMDLIPIREGLGENLGPRELKLSESAARLADVEMSPVVRTIPEMNVRMVGKIEYDESRLAYITARYPGRLDRLYVDYTGVTVNKGDHLAEIYSPNLLIAQQELIQAKRGVSELAKDALPVLHERAVATLESAREKLRLWDLTREQIAQIELSEASTDHLTVNAPMGGVVIHKNAVEGVYLDTGGRIYTIADLSSLWVKLDAYESDLQWIHYGQEVEFETEAYPGEIFSGRIAFLDPVLNPKTRTVKVRVNVENQAGRLKPDMFVRAVVKSKIATGGRVMDSRYAGKWISPMHPEIVRDKPGDCPVCGMQLVTAESLGYAPGTNDSVAPLVIPDTAPLITGKRAIVYVATTNRPGIYEGRQITLGPRAGKVFVVKEGLKEGELVVTRGNFKIDSAIQILAKHSMMSGEEAAGGKHEHRAAEHLITPLSAPPAFTAQLRVLIDAYAAAGSALDSDKLPDQRAVARLSDALAAVDMKLVEGEAHMAWMMDAKEVAAGIASLKHAPDIEKGRTGFAQVSMGLIAARKRFEVEGIYEFHCPMAFANKGANWLQTNNRIRNPYFGSSMLKCGELVEGRQESEGVGRGAGAGKEDR